MDPLLLVTGGGENMCDVFMVKATGTDGAYEIYDGSIAVPVANPTPDRTDAVIQLGALADTKPSFQEDGTVKISFDNYQDDPNFWDFLGKMNPATAAAAAAAGRPEVIFENKAKIGGTTASTSGIYALVISYGAPSPDGTKRKVLVSLGSISPTSGSYSQKADDYSKPTLEFTSIKVTKDLLLPVGLFVTGTTSPADDGKIDAAALAVEATGIIKLKTNEGFKVKYVDLVGA